MTEERDTTTDLSERTRDAIAQCCAERVASRIWERDPSLWPGDAHEWLDWLEAPRPPRTMLAQLDAVAAGARAHDDVLLLGMGGSSLCPEVLAESFGRQAGFPRLRILDSSVPADVLQRTATVDPARTLVIVASKSGTTLETDVARRHFTELLPPAADGTLPMIAITDPDTALSTLAADQRYRHVALGQPGIGGRFSALSIFGLLPAAAMGLDVPRLLASAQAMAARCKADTADNPGLALGVAMASAAAAGRNKLTLVCSQPIATLGAWVEQLVAESTGKDGKGIVPVDLEPLGAAGQYGDDRLFVHVRLTGDDSVDDGLSALAQAGHPVITLDVEDSHGLGGEFFRFQFATAVAGHLMKLNPFDQPDVEAAKRAARRMMEQQADAQPQQRRVGDIEDVALWVAANTQPTSTADAATTLRDAVDDLPPGGYIALQAYVQRSQQTHAALARMRDRLRTHSMRATTYGFGPRFLHSTGQLHKGGPDSVLCLQITADDPQPLAIPGKDFDFGALARAQAAGDFEVLAERGRRVLRLHVPSDDAASLDALDATLERVLARS